MSGHMTTEHILVSDRVRLQQERDDARTERDRAVDLLLKLWSEGVYDDTAIEHEVEDFLRVQGKLP